MYTYSSALVNVSSGKLDKDLGIPLDSFLGAGDGQVVDAVLVDLFVMIKRRSAVSFRWCLLRLMCATVAPHPFRSNVNRERERERGEEIIKCAEFD